jgi:hypothetical protein
MLFPAPAEKSRNESLVGDKKVREERTIAMDPQQGTILLPVSKCPALDKPRCGSSMLSFACDIVIDGWIRSREPFSKQFQQFDPWKYVSALRAK